VQIKPIAPARERSYSDANLAKRCLFIERLALAHSDRRVCLWSGDGLDD
jgi:hypothetical protein